MKPHALCFVIAGALETANELRRSALVPFETLRILRGLLDDDPAVTSSDHLSPRLFDERTRRNKIFLKTQYFVPFIFTYIQRTTEI